MRGPAIVLAFLMLAGPARADVQRYALIVGDDRGESDEARLRYAAQDAQRLYDVLRELGGFRPEDMLLYKNESAETVRAGLISLNDRIRTQSAVGHPSELLVYYSGHGDGTSLHLDGTELQTRELEQLVRGSAATLRILILDSCRSGGLTRVKGGRITPAFPLSVDERMPGDGLVFWTASAESESAQESDELGGSFFTHYLVSGLHGAADLDGNGNVTLGEAYQYAYENTLRATSRTLAGAQHPTFRYELGGEGEVVLAMVARNAAIRASVGFPIGKSYLLLRDGADGPVVAEVGAHDRIRRLSLKPGRYFVRGRAPDYLVEGTVAVAPSEDLVVRDEDLERIQYARLVRKGRSARGRAYEIEAGYAIRTALFSGGGSCQGPFVGFGVDLPAVTLAPRVGVCRGSLDNRFLHADADEVDVELRGTHSWDVGRVSIGVGVGVGAAYLRQDFAEGVAPSRNAVAAHLGVLGDVVVDLVQGFYGGIELDGMTYFFNQEARAGDRLESPFALRISVLLLGKRW